ncbi:MAG: sulfatase-like hydrolase/transferase [Bdellovibrionaceae bacterium]|nr:sulfatase-like hydrolase/transferase [Bdellovibrionales bacterium]MCB9083351.1 sulfatase-like hydrolase/transferase [Pseudobdellovibrionaceae bacterium]
MLFKVLGGRGRLLFYICLSFLVPFSLMRLGFYWFFRSGETPSSDLMHAFYLGLKFDTRVVLVFLLVPALAMLLPALNPFRRNKVIPLWTAWYSLCFFASLFFYALDFAYYSYLGLRVNATVLHFLENPIISAQMVWQTYPVILILLSLALTTTVFTWWTKRLMEAATTGKGLTSTPRTGALPGWQAWVKGFTVVLLMLAGLYGKVSAYPLRWSEAYFSTNTFVASLGMNPIHYFFDTLDNREEPFNKDKVRHHYQQVADYLGVEDRNEETLNFDRWLEPKGLLPQTTNVVLIVMESFAAHKTGVLGHPLDPTPNFDVVAKKGKLFDRFFVPSEGTARSIFGVLTGIPDVGASRTSSRNPLIVDQHTLINAFKAHQKFYFIGGSANWGNIRGVIAHNIPDMKIVEEGMFESPRTDVWGISDYDLFVEANRQLSELPSHQPFFAVVQTAGFHRPYTIPESRGHFKETQLNDGEIKKYGFVSNEEYNSLRFSDYSLGHFLELASKAPYYQNTLFVIIGDHGLPDLEAQHLSKGFQHHHITRFQVPLVFYHPGWKSEPEVIHKFATEPDVLVTIASLTGHKTLVRTFGRDLWDTRFDDRRFAFHYVYYRSPPHIALMDDDFYLVAEPGRREGLYDYKSDTPAVDQSAAHPERAQKMMDLTMGLYETAKYLLYHNPNPLKATGKPAKD